MTPLTGKLRVEWKWTPSGKTTRFARVLLPLFDVVDAAEKDHAARHPSGLLVSQRPCPVCVALAALRAALDAEGLL